jgi:tetratricopeptide (TPR) repeat protein
VFVAISGNAAMNAPLRACLLLLVLAPFAGAAPTVQEARQRWLKGNYEEAQSLFEELLKDAKNRSVATVGLSRTLESQGEYDKALGVVETALKDAPKDANLLARRAEILYTRGRWKEAREAADSALAANPKQFAAHWVRVQVFRDQGELDKAQEEVRWFLRAYNADEAKTAEELLLVGLASAEHARWNKLADEFKTILTDVYGDALKAEPDFWFAEYEAGVLLLEKYNRGEALDALDKALTINPNAAEALVLKGIAAYMRFEFKDSEKFAERALKFNPSLPEALRLRADVYLAGGDAKSALKELAEARKINPRDERTLARVAACYILQNNKAELTKLTEEVQNHDSKPAVYYFELGERLEDRRRYGEAETYYQLAMKLRPKLPGPLNSLGMLYMRLGKEEEAGKLLDEGFKADAFNVRVSNMRKVLKHLSNYKTLKTEHFQLRYDPNNDAVLAHLMADYLEQIYADLAKKFDYRPKGPILIEVFRNHEMFSGRTVALPDLHTIGACTGRVITMCTPNEKRAGEKVRKAFNWGRVIRHELVHIFNLEQTNFLVPHWLTEGLAVQNEGFPRPAPWNRLLAERVPADKLLNLDTIDLGFIRPRDPMEWQQAYCQAQLYVQYIEQEYGQEAIGKLLAAFARGAGIDEALAAGCKNVDRKTFEKGYRAYLDEVVKPLLAKRPVEKKRTLEQLQAEYKKNPDDPDLAAEIALRLVSSRKSEARKLAELARDKKANHPVASYVLARLESAAGNDKEERRLLESAFNKDDPNPLVGKALGKIYYDASEFDKAAGVYEALRKAEPFERDWLIELARIYTQMENKSRQIQVLTELVPTDADDLDRRVRLAKLLLDAGKPADAERYAREALEIDVTNDEAREAIYKALGEQGKKAELERLKGILETKEGAK